jgi:hypothetical protein
LADKPVDRRHEVFGHMIRPYPTFLAQTFGRLAVACANQDDLSTTCPPGARNILQAIPHHAGLGQVQSIVSLGLVNQSRFWLSATAAIFRNMRAIIDSFYGATMGEHSLRHVPMNLLNRFLCGHFSIDRRLIGDDNDMIPMKGQELQGFKTSGQELEF